MTVKIDIVARADLRHQRGYAERLAQGLGRHGVAARFVGSIEEVQAPVAACWGWRLGSQLKARGKRVLVMERGYIGDRFHWTSLGWDGLNGRARWPQIDDGGERFRRHFADLLKPERSGAGAYALVIGQVPGDASLIGVDITRFYKDASKALACRFGARICFRPHPVHVQRGFAPGPFMYGMTVHDGELEEALQGAACVAGWNSNALTDAVLAGVPVTAMDPGAMAWPVAGHGFDEPPALRDRGPWAHRMAWTQWTPAEIASGAAWEAVATAMEPERQVA
jgi:hypothetical protein